MKKLLILVLAAMTVGTLYAQTDNSKAERKQNRKEARTEREEAYSKKIEGWLEKKDFRFYPQTVEQASSKVVIIDEPASVSMLYDQLKVNIPIVRGTGGNKYYVPLKFNSVVVKDYKYEKTKSGWMVSFVADGFDGNVYTFRFDIDTSSQSTRLTLSMPAKPKVYYSGSLKDV